MEENITRINNSGKSLKTQHNHLQDGTKFLDGRQIKMKNFSLGEMLFILHCNIKLYGNRVQTGCLDTS